MKYRVFLILVVVLLYSFCFKNVSAGELCSPKGYTILTLNGIFTDLNGAIYNRNKLASKFDTTYSNQPLVFDYLYNPSHIGGIADIVDVIKQGFFDQKSDYDLVEMLNDASNKVMTQKLLLVAHSQGNFYANNFYDKVASKQGGVPSQSIGVYSVATPAGYVAGGGKYLTSDTDQIIASLVGGTLKRRIVSPNTHIDFQKNDDGGQGHDFSKIYLRYQGNKIISDIKSSLDKLKSNDEQDVSDPCISPPELTAVHKMEGVALNSADFVVNGGKNIIVTVAGGMGNLASTIGTGVYNAGLSVKNAVGGLLASVVSSNPNPNGLVTTLSATPSATNPKTSTVKPTTSNPSINNSLVAAPITALNILTGNSALNTAFANAKVNPIISSFLPSWGGGGSGGAILALEPETPDENSPTPPGDETGDETSPDPVVPPTPGTILPVVTILGDNPASVNVGDVYTDAGATALDDVDGDLTSAIIKGGTFVDTTTEGGYNITYTVTDSAGNIGTATRIINVITVTPPDVGETPPTPPSPHASNVLYSQPDSSTEINFSSVASFDTFTGKSGHIQGIKFAYNDHGISAGNFIGVSVVDRTTGESYYGKTEESNGCGNTYESIGANAKIIVELDSAIHYKAYPCTGPDLVLDPTHTYGIALFPNNFVLSNVRFYGASNNNNAVYLEVTDDSIPSAGKSIKSFKFPNLGATGVIDETNHQIAVSVPFGTNVSALAPVIKISGGASVVPGSGVPQNFSSPVSYVVTAQNGAYVAYQVNVSVRQNVIYSQPDNSVEITDISNILLQNIITGAVGKITDLKFSYNDHGSGADQFLGVQIQDQTAAISYYAWKPGISENCGDAYQSHSINAPIIAELNSTFEYREYPCTGANLILDPTHTYNISLFRNRGGLPYNTQRFYGSSNSNAAAYFYIESDGIMPPPPFPQSTLPSSLKAITSFDFTNLTPNIVGVVDETNNVISLTVPFGTDVKKLVPTVTLSEKATILPESNTVQDFSHSFNYTVTAEDKTIQNYTVNVVVAPDQNLDTVPPTISALAISSAEAKSSYVKIGGVINLSITADAPLYTAKSIKINDIATTNFKDNGNGTYTASYTVSSGDNDVVSGNIPVSVILTDASLNSNVEYTTVQKNTLKIDAHAPTLVSAKVVAPLSLEVAFSEDIDGGTVNSSGSEFKVSGHSVFSAHEADGTITLTLSSEDVGIKTGEAPMVTFSSPKFEDNAGNQAISPATVTAINNI